jgi:hypothetical protein
MSWEPVDVNLINHGDVVGQVNHHINEAVKDALDPNKPANKVRRVTLKIEILPTEDRQQAAIKATVETKFPPDVPGVDMLTIYRDGKRGFINTDEQLDIFDPKTGEVPSLIRTEKTND